MVKEYTTEYLMKMHHMLLDRALARQRYEEMFELFGWLVDMEDEWVASGFSDKEYLRKLVDAYVDAGIREHAQDLVTFLMDFKDRFCAPETGEADELTLDDIFADEFALDDFASESEAAIGSEKPVYYQCGKTIEMGRYAASEMGVPDTIKWTIIDRDGDHALVLANRILEILPFNRAYENTSWEKSDVREWLANDFYAKVFTDAEKTRILESSLENGKADGVHGVMVDDIFMPTQDHVFLLSGKEVKKYLVGESIIRAEATDYVKSQNVPSVIAGKYRWWGRSMGINATTACVIDYNWVNGYGEFVNSAGVGIRPAMWIDISAR